MNVSFGIWSNVKFLSKTAILPSEAVTKCKKVKLTLQIMRTKKRHYKQPRICCKILCTSFSTLISQLKTGVWIGKQFDQWIKKVLNCNQANKSRLSQFASTKSDPSRQITTKFRLIKQCEMALWKRRGISKRLEKMPSNMYSLLQTYAN